MTTSSTSPQSGLDKPTLHPLQHMSQSFYLLKVSLVLHPSSFSFVGILYFVICFQTVSQPLADMFSVA